MRNFFVWAGTGGIALVMIGLLFSTAAFRMDATLNHQFEEVSDNLPEADEPRGMAEYTIQRPVFTELVTREKFDEFLRLNPELKSPFTTDQ